MFNVGLLHATNTGGETNNSTMDANEAITRLWQKKSPQTELLPAGLLVRINIYALRFFRIYYLFLRACTSQNRLEVAFSY